MRGLLVLLIGLAAVSASPSQRIVGGSVVNGHQYPDMAALLFSNNANAHLQACGGVIINNRSILTTAHCVAQSSVPLWWRIRLGSLFANSGGVVLQVSQFIIHPQYNPNNRDNDIAYIRVASSINFSNVIRAAGIATNVVGDNQVVWAAGWGQTYYNGPKSEALRHVQLRTVNQVVCRQNYASIGRVVSDNMLCAGWPSGGGFDQCNGDDGGPLYLSGSVVGLSSWGYNCGLANFPSVNTRISRYLGWIGQNS